MEPTWNDAACHSKDVDPEWFFIEREGREGEGERKRKADRAKAICASCPIRDSLCLPYAMSKMFEQPVLEGIWAGTTVSARINMRRAWKRSNPDFSPPVKRTRDREFNPSACGTALGYQRHLRYDQQACSDCLEAKRIHAKEYRAARKAADLACA